MCSKDGLLIVLFEIEISTVLSFFQIFLFVVGYSDGWWVAQGVPQEKAGDGVQAVRRTCRYSTDEQGIH